MMSGMSVCVSWTPPDRHADSLRRPYQRIRERLSGRADLVIANILAGPLMDLSDRLLDFLKPGGTLLLSGLIDRQAEALCDHYSKRIALTSAVEIDGWVCLRGATVDSA